MKIRNLLIGLLVLGVSFSRAADQPVQTKVILSPVYKIDKIYKSMEGPQSTQSVTLLDSPTPELLWITGFKTEMVDGSGTQPTLPEFMCHVNLDLNYKQHMDALKSCTLGNSRVLTLSQGQIDVQFPEGYGMPIMSNEALSLTTQVLNHNIEKPNMDVRHKVTFSFIRDQELKTALKPLFNTSAFGMKVLEGDGGHFGMSDADPAKNGPSCLPGATAPNAHGGSVYQDTYKKKFTGHWVVKPGKEINHTNVTKYLNIPYDTQLHFAAIHLHPYSQSIELRDLTAGKTVFKSKARGYKNKIGLSHVDSISSKEGIPLYKDHQYDLISVYNNTTNTDKDSMAVVLLFVEDHRFKAPPKSSADPISASISPAEKSTAVNPQKIIFQTGLGNMTFKLYPDVAPRTVAHIVSLVQAGAYDNTYFYRVEPGFVAQIPSAADRTPVPAEFSRIKHRRGVLSIARETNNVNSGESSFSILLGDAPHLDALYTVFGELETGWETLQKIERVTCDAQHKPLTRLSILKIKLQK